MGLKKKDITYSIDSIHPTDEITLDIEDWLADLLVNYWLAMRDGGNGCCPLLPENIGPESSLVVTYKKGTN